MRTRRRATPSDRIGRAAVADGVARGAPRRRRQAGAPGRHARHRRRARAHPPGLVRGLARRGGVTAVAAGSTPTRTSSPGSMQASRLAAGATMAAARAAARGRGRGRLRRGAAAGPPCLRRSDARLLPAEQRRHRGGRRCGPRAGPADRDRRLGRAPRRRHAGHLRCRCGPRATPRPTRRRFYPGTGSAAERGRRAAPSAPSTTSRCRQGAATRLRRGLDGRAAAGDRGVRPGGDPGLGRLRRPSRPTRSPMLEVTEARLRGGGAALGELAPRLGLPRRGAHAGGRLRPGCAARLSAAATVRGLLGGPERGSVTGYTPFIQNSD